MIGLLLILSLYLPSVAIAATFESFTEPVQQITLASPETGILEEIRVKPGDTVRKGQVLALLDNQVFSTLLAIANVRKNADGRLNAAQAIQRLKQEKLSRLMSLANSGYIQPHEMSQAKIELELAKAEVQTAKELLHIHALEYRHIQAQIERRILRSPINGTVTEVHKSVAELVGGHEAHVMTLANLTTLIVTIHVPTDYALNLSLDQQVDVQFPNSSFATVMGQIHTISPITDAGSSTVVVDIHLDNSQSKLRSGIKALVNLTPPAP